MVTSASSTLPPTSRLSRKALARAVGAATIGNALEWFDWSTYSAFAAIFSLQIFGGHGRSALLSALAVFGVVVGIRLNWSRRGDRPDPNSRTYRRLFEAAAKSGLHVEVLIEDAHLPAIADAVLGEGAALVIDHFGLAAGVRTPGVAAMLRALEGGSAWVKLSAPYRLPTSEVRQLTEVLLSTAPHRLLWGSDWPWVQHESDVSDYGACLSALDHVVPDPVLRTAVLVDNPAQMLGLA